MKSPRKLFVMGMRDAQLRGDIDFDQDAQHVSEEMEGLYDNFGIDSLDEYGESPDDYSEGNTGPPGHRHAHGTDTDNHVEIYGPDDLLLQDERIELAAMVNPLERCVDMGMNIYHRARWVVRNILARREVA